MSIPRDILLVIVVAVMVFGAIGIGFWLDYLSTKKHRDSVS